MTTTYTKLPSGSWGIKVSLRKSKDLLEISAGMTLDVVTRDGRTKEVTVSEVLSTTSRPETTDIVCAIA